MTDLTPEEMTLIRDTWRLGHGDRRDGAGLFRGMNRQPDGPLRRAYILGWHAADDGKEFGPDAERELFS